MSYYPEGAPLTSDRLIAQVKQGIKEIDVHQLKQRIEDGDTLVVDIREFDEYAQGAIPGSHYIPRGFLELRIENLAPQRDTPIALYCAGGVRSALGARSLQEMGYTDVVSVEERRLLL
jgi:rhodanese-related sulfurtransferase